MPFPSEKAEPAFKTEQDVLAAAKADDAFFMVYHAYCLRGRNFDNEGNVAKQRDLMKCFTLFQMVAMRAYLNFQIGKLDKPDFNPEQAARYLLDRAQKIKFVTSQMMTETD